MPEFVLNKISATYLCYSFKKKKKTMSIICVLTGDGLGFVAKINVF